MPINAPCASPLAEPSPESNDPTDDPDADESRSRLSDELVPVPDDDTTEASSTSLDDLFSNASCEKKCSGSSRVEMRLPE